MVVRIANKVQKVDGFVQIPYTSVWLERRFVVQVPVQQGQSTFWAVNQTEASKHAADTGSGRSMSVTIETASDSIASVGCAP